MQGWSIHQKSRKRRTPLYSSNATNLSQKTHSEQSNSNSPNISPPSGSPTNHNRIYPQGQIGSPNQNHSAQNTNFLIKPIDISAQSMQIVSRPGEYGDQGNRSNAVSPSRSPGGSPNPAKYQDGKPPNPLFFNACIANQASEATQNPPSPRNLVPQQQNHFVGAQQSFQTMIQPSSPAQMNTYNAQIRSPSPQGSPTHSRPDNSPSQKNIPTYQSAPLQQIQYQQQASSPNLSPLFSPPNPYRLPSPNPSPPFNQYMNSQPQNIGVPSPRSNSPNPLMGAFSPQNPSSPQHQPHNPTSSPGIYKPMNLHHHPKSPSHPPVQHPLPQQPQQPHPHPPQHTDIDTLYSLLTSTQQKLVQCQSELAQRDSVRHMNKVFEHERSVYRERESGLKNRLMETEGRCAQLAGQNAELQARVAGLEQRLGGGNFGKEELVAKLRSLTETVQFLSAYKREYDLVPNFPNPGKRGVKTSGPAERRSASAVSPAAARTDLLGDES